MVRHFYKPIRERLHSMTKLIALLAVLAAVAWGITATASWITSKKAPLALAAGRVPAQPTTADENRAMMLAQWRMVAGLVFATVMFVALFRVSIGLSGQAGLTTVLIAGLSASGGLLLYAALPARRLAGTDTSMGGRMSAAPLLRKRVFVLPAAVLLVYVGFVVIGGVADAPFLAWENGVPALLVAVAMAGSSLLALRHLATKASLTDPRLATIDRHWRETSAANLIRFTGGALLTHLGATAIINGLAIVNTERLAPSWATVMVTGGAALAVAGVVLLVVAAKGTLTLRATVHEKAAAPITA